MSTVEEVENLEFKWGKKRGVGGKKKEVKFYESFTYDGLEYTLHDCVYMHKEGEPEPYIGKLIKIWENPDKSKKVKVQWFFHPLEILNWLGDIRALHNEIFLASGDGVGLANINTLEAISGKCNVVCISKDSRNPQPSEEELKMADFVFYRTFDVQHCTILDKMDDKVGGLDVKFIFNKKESENASAVTKIDSERKEDENIAIAQNTTEEMKTQKGERYDSNLAKDVLVKRDPLPGSAKDVSIRQGSVLGEKTICGNGDSNKDEVKAEERVKDGKDFADDRPSKKAKIDNSINLSDDKSFNSTKKLSVKGNDVKALATNPNSADEKTKSRLGKDSLVTDKGVKSAKVDVSFKVPLKEKPDEKIKKVSSGKLPKVSTSKAINEERENEGQVIEVTRRPDVDRRKWFRELPWEERMQGAHEQGTLVLLQNLDSKYTSDEVEDIIWHAFKENCSSKMVQRTTISTPHFGEAFVIFKTRDAAEKVVRKLDEGCLMLSNGRPLVGSTRPFASFPGKQSTYFGHLVIDKTKLQMQREMGCDSLECGADPGVDNYKKDAVSTSHCSQPNTIEYEMAMDWCLLQSRSAGWWKRLYKQQGEELRKLKANLKSK